MALALLLFLASPSTAVVVDFAGDGAPWFAASLEQVLVQELTRFSRVTLLDKSGECAERNVDCLVALHAAAGADVIVLGTVTGTRLDYEVHETWTPARVTRGSFVAAGMSRARLEQRLNDIVRPIAQSGGLADQRPLTDGGDRSYSLASAQRAQVPWLALALAIFVWLPAIVLRLLIGHRVRPVPASWKWLAAIVVLLALAAGASLVDLPKLPKQALAIAVPIGGGLLWGALLVASFSYVFAPLSGMSHARHDVLRSLIQAWLARAALRLCALSLYALVAFAAVLVAQAAEVDRRAVWLVVVPGAVLLLRLWLLALADNLASYLDDALVHGTASENNPWHVTMKRYFRGYLRRGGVSLDRDVIEHALFLPGKAEGVVFYGGGLGRPRIVVGDRAREAAMGELPDEPEAPERTVNHDELSWGWLLTGAENKKQQSDRAEARRRALVRAPQRTRVPMPRLLGENATVLGWVVPAPRTQTVPLISNTREDYAVVRSLLTEHYAAFESQVDYEYDATDPSHKDFLFGAMVLAVGGLASGEGPSETFALALPKAHWLSALHARFVAWPSSSARDAYVALKALHQGLHALIQYLQHLRAFDASFLTARAAAPELVAVSKRILDEAAQETPDGPDRQALRPTPRNRLLWLERFLDGAPRPASRRRGIIAAVALVVALAAGAALVREAILYRPVYRARLSATQGATHVGPEER